MNGMAADPGVLARPSRLTSLAVSAALVVVWVGLRLVVFETTLVPLTYAIPLLACVWTRDRAALWAMAAIFAVAHGVKIFWLMPAGQISGLELWTNLAATFSNIGIGALAVHAIIRLRTSRAGTRRGACPGRRDPPRAGRSVGHDPLPQPRHLPHTGGERGALHAPGRGPRPRRAPRRRQGGTSAGGIGADPRRPLRV